RSDAVVLLDDDWFWVQTEDARRNRIVRAVRSMLAVTPSLGLAAVMEGLARCYRYTRDQVPPFGVVRAVLESHPGFTVREGEVRSLRALDPRLELTRVERAILGVFRSECQHVLTSARFLRACNSVGVGTHTFWTVATSSAILDQPARATWALR